MGYKPSKRMRQALEFWLHVQKLPAHNQKAVLCSLSDTQLDTLAELVDNLLNSACPIDYNDHIKLMRRYKELHTIASPRVSSQQKKALLQSGNGLSLLNIALLALPTLFELLL